MRCSPRLRDCYPIYLDETIQASPAAEHVIATAFHSFMACTRP